jgi:hypothetical protein
VRYVEFTTDVLLVWIKLEPFFLFPWSDSPVVLSSLLTVFLYVPRSPQISMLLIPLYFISLIILHTSSRYKSGTFLYNEIEQN